MIILRPITSNHLLLVTCLLILQWGMISCNGMNKAQSPIELYEYQDTVAITPSPRNITPDELLNGKVRLALGKIKNYEGKIRLRKIF